MYFDSYYLNSSYRELNKIVKHTSPKEYGEYLITKKRKKKKRGTK